MVSIGRFKESNGTTFSHYGTISGRLAVIYTTITKSKKGKTTTLEIFEVDNEDRKTVEGLIKKKGG